ncbi:Flagellar secretion chaperone FliS [Paenibacillus allorhizoplanae]|uniref:Flagellar secretion chaperone FliS n=1 Tax=Paenibacillus allorhizoplanae TaxID=2905648 RepID=A0ABN8GR06_9BACL|nr:flagellar export chaperone FliS [Paenibacillus allorhizoplanae]CAH1215748.1 Flagellar secretion chaperone FliS [Paenibacillus allorhizoplanae]
MIQAQRNKYLENTVQTASPAQLLIMLCDGAIRFCRAGIEALKNTNYQDANTNLVKVQDIISEFSITIDRNAPIAVELLRLYEYFNYRLIEANMKKSVEPAEEVLGYLIQLKETWMQAALQVKSGAVSTAPAGATHG